MSAVLSEQKYIEAMKSPQIMLCVYYQGGGTAQTNFCPAKPCIPFSTDTLYAFGCGLSIPHPFLSSPKRDAAFYCTPLLAIPS